jgi:Methyltransferase domain
MLTNTKIGRPPWRHLKSQPDGGADQTHSFNGLPLPPHDVLASLYLRVEAPRGHTYAKSRPQSPRASVVEAVAGPRRRRTLFTGPHDHRHTLGKARSVKTPDFLEHYRNQPFEKLFSEYIEQIDGWLDAQEALLLYELARSVNTGCIVEIGCYRGRSTSALAFGSIAGFRAPVYSIDPQESFVGPCGGEFGPIDRGFYMQRIVDLGLFYVVRLVNLSSESLSGSWPMPVGLLWIDGDHNYESVVRDFWAWKEKLSDDASVVLHDASDPAWGPGRLAREIAATGDFAIAELRGSAVWLKKCCRCGTTRPAQPSRGLLSAIGRELVAKLRPASR